MPLAICSHILTTKNIPCTYCQRTYIKSSLRYFSFLNFICEQAHYFDSASSHVTGSNIRPKAKEIPSQCTTNDSLQAMTSGTWPSKSTPPECSSVGPLNYLSTLSYFSPSITYPITAGSQGCGDLPVIGNPYSLGRFAFQDGLHLGLSTPPFPAEAGYQAYLGPYPPLCYPAPDDFHNPSVYHGNYIGNQAPTTYNWVPYAPISVQEVAPRYQTDVEFRRQNALTFSHALQPFRRDIDWGDTHAIATEIKKLKQEWREGIGIRRYRRDKRTESYESRAREWTATQEENTPVSIEGTLDGEAKDTTKGFTSEQGDNFNHESSDASSAISSEFNESIATDQLDEAILAREEFEQIEIVPSPDVTPTQTNPIAKNKVDKSQAKTTRDEHQPLKFGFKSKAVKSPASESPTLSDTPKPKSSTSPTKAVASLRPPKIITRSSKPVTQPVPFNLVGNAVSRKLKLQRDKRLQSAGGKA